MSTLSGAMISSEAAGSLWVLLFEATGIEGIESIIASNVL
jgi:hypothetical protein